MQKITPHLWFDTQAKQAANFYTSLFENSKIISSSQIHDTPSGDADIIEVEIGGLHFTLLNAGPYFKFNPSISFSISCETAEEVDALWAKLIDGGSALMDLGVYPFSPKYGWLQDKFGLSWQIMAVQPGQHVTQKITPTLMFTQHLAGKTEEALNFYKSVFHDADFSVLMRYGKGEEPDKEGTVKYAQMKLEGIQFAAMDSAQDHKFVFNEAISFLIHCDSQEEIDYYWNKLSADPAAEQCGWLKDKFSVSWQVVPNSMGKMMSEGSPEQIARVTQAFLKMKKFDLQKLQDAYDGKEQS